MRRMGVSRLPTPSPSREASVAAGLAARERASLGSHAVIAGSPTRDPLGLLAAQEAVRVPELIPVRHERMTASPFAFFRGAAIIMADDLSRSEHSGIITQLCGDAHLANFGAYGSPERRLVFDLNDFDETLPGPFEWDVKRLCASVAVAARDNGMDDDLARRVAVETAAAYQRAMAQFASRPLFEVWYARIDAEEQLANLAEGSSKRLAKTLGKRIDKAKKRTSLKALAKLTEEVDGQRRFVPDPPLLVPAEDLQDVLDYDSLYEWLRVLVDKYTHSLSPERRWLVDNFTLTHVARKVVGVGSVGTRVWILLMEAHDGSEPLLLQAKEAKESVLSAYLGDSQYVHQGERVVTGQRVMQAASDVLLGWQRTEREDFHIDYYVRQLRDWKYSVDVSTYDADGLTTYGRLCAWTLARAHARSGDRIAIATYLGEGDEFASAIGDFSVAYADVTDLDHVLLVRATA
jgi:uncharacterized protein (DUF2252 family)